jgi:maltodextrin utilization protein YvdJ
MPSVVKFGEMTEAGRDWYAENRPHLTAADYLVAVLWGVGMFACLMGVVSLLWMVKR